MTDSENTALSIVSLARGTWACTPPDVKRRHAGRLCAAYDALAVHDFHRAIRCGLESIRRAVGADSEAYRKAAEWARR